MELETFQKLIRQFHERQQRQWIVVSGSLFLAACIGMISLTLRQVQLHADLKYEYEQLISKGAAVKEMARHAQKDTKKYAALKKHSLLFKQESITPTLEILSQTIPPSVYLSAVCIKNDHTIALTGYAPDMLALTSFTAKLEEQLTTVKLEESAFGKGGILFKISSCSK